MYSMETRVKFGVGAVMAESIEDVRAYMAKQAGAEWFPSDFVPMPPFQPLPKEYQ